MEAKTATVLFIWNDGTKETREIALMPNGNLPQRWRVVRFSGRALSLTSNPEKLVEAARDNTVEFMLCKTTDNLTFYQERITAVGKLH